MNNKLAYFKPQLSKLSFIKTKVLVRIFEKYVWIIDVRFVNHTPFVWNIKLFVEKWPTLIIRTFLQSGAIFQILGNFGIFLIVLKSIVWIAEGLLFRSCNNFVANRKFHDHLHLYFF
eukprot:TRINITY_DN14154_c0_g1_i6.p2 TRINITY_DN14154_c0_g1~~TRINITY_DN14154_c0_g1_i6.p2  ORF type:complete len:117 (-),score=6.65 TRINITY_DN14154_c0_g1_i6:53-403(-)